ncbi:sulfite exporter TauE/SafE family protein [Limnobacter humi]|uniref:Probable membrane transporter protein n=1 Tax=Limnobacter humi TaxID=1778671 RepID=A0ABT1WHW5_9BURK|nr:sulfite exporter TauE/SafE family protein [Limnobacter humi]MCQ8896302.1 sulfite exporter TauE/SafE family protein [Limnobacter humi]
MLTVVAALGLIVGVILALTGAGGGVLAVPLLVFGLHQTVQQAAPIALLAVGMAATLGAALAHRQGDLRYKAAALMGGIGLIFSPVGLWLAHRLDPQWLNGLFAVVLLWIARQSFRSQLNPGLPAEANETDLALLPCMRDDQSGKFIWTLPCARALAFAGALTGLLSGLLGVGGGFVLVPALQRFTNLSMQSITATALGVIAVVSWFGAFHGLKTAGMDWQLAATFSAAALAGMVGGRGLSKRMPALLIRRLFGVLSVLVALLMLKSVFAQ